MKFEIEKNKIEGAIIKASKLANKHLTLPVLSCVYIDALNNKILIKSTNLDIGLEMEVKAKILEEGSVAVPASVLVGLLSSIKEDNLIFETKDNNLNVISNKNSVVIKCMPTEDFPSIPKLNSNNELKISSKDLILGFKSVWYSASNSNIKPELSSVYIYKQDNDLVFVSTDSFRLAEKKVNAKIQKDFPNTLIPYKNVVEIMKIFDDYKGDIEISFEKNQSAFKTDGIYIISRIIDGSFPDYKQIIPKSFICSVTLIKNDLINSIKASNIFSDSLNQIKFKINNKKFVLESKNNEVGEYIETISASVSGDNLELNFNSRYIIDCLQSITSDSISLDFGGIGKPLLITGVSDKSFSYIVMPMNR